MITIIYPYRNRDFKRVENSLDSLKDQTSANFEVKFVDYGSHSQMAAKIKQLCSGYPFVDYHYQPTSYQPWNKSRALNSVIKNLESEYCFVADVDLIFHSQFIEKASRLQDGDRSVYFQVGFLPSGVEPDKSFFITRDYRTSTHEATGLSMFPVRVLKDLRGFDEFYHFWGAEDTDMHVRLKNAGYEINFYDKEVLLLHQWHPSYRSEEKKTITNELQIARIVQLNHQYLKNVINNKKTRANPKSWGEVMTVVQKQTLLEKPVTTVLDNEKKKIDELLYGQLAQMPYGNIKVQIKKISFADSFQWELKRFVGRKIPEFYTLKDTNDLVLLHLISFYRDMPYIFQVDKEMGTITFGIMKI